MESCSYSTMIPRSIKHDYRRKGGLIEQDGGGGVYLEVQQDEQTNEF